MGISINPPYKTTTSVNLSAGLALLGYKVLLVDIDPQGNTTSGLGIDKSLVQNCIYDLLIHEASLEEVLLETSVNNLYLLPATLQLAGAEIELAQTISRELRLKNAFQMINDSFSFIIIDCPPSLGVITLNALTAAQSVLIPIQCEFYALEGLGQLLQTVRIVQQHLNKDLFIEGVLLTMYDARTNLSSQVMQEVKDYFNERVYRTIIPRNVRLSEAPSHGQSIFQYDARSRGAMFYQDLAKEVAEDGQ